MLGSRVCSEVLSWPPPPLYSVWDPSPWGDAAHPHTGWAFSPHLLLSGNTRTAQRRVLDDPKPSQADEDELSQTGSKHRYYIGPWDGNVHPLSYQGV